MDVGRILTLSTETIIPDNACSPVASTQVNLGPKSLKTDLSEHKDRRDLQRNCNLPKQTTGVGRDKIYTVSVCPVIDFELFLIGSTTKNDHLYLECKLNMINNHLDPLGMGVSCLRIFLVRYGHQGRAREHMHSALINVA